MGILMICMAASETSANRTIGNIVSLIYLGLMMVAMIIYFVTRVRDIRRELRDFVVNWESGNHKRYFKFAHLPYVSLEYDVFPVSLGPLILP